jgi:hypothetical protein
VTTSPGTGAAGTTTTANNATSSNSGQPVDITDAPNVGTSAANTVSKALGGVSSGIQQAEGNAAAAGTSWLGSIFSAGTDIFARSAFVILGLLILGGAIVFFAIESKSSSAPAYIPAPV